MKPLDLEGVHKWNLTGIRKISTSGPAVWEFKCDCGNTTTVVASDFKRGRTKSCGCLRNRTGANNPTWGGYEDISAHMWQTMRYHSKRRGRKFTITMPYIWQLFLKQNKKCAISGVDISFGDKTKLQRTERSNKTASLDRIDSSKGYIEGNVQWVHKTVNQMKSDHVQTDFVAWCKLVAKHNDT